jgi:hypothetical protein
LISSCKTLPMAPFIPHITTFIFTSYFSMVEFLKVYYYI